MLYTKCMRKVLHVHSSLYYQFKGVAIEGGQGLGGWRGGVGEGEGHKET